MIRLAVSDGFAPWNEVAIRLHGASIAAEFEARHNAFPIEACDGVLIAGCETPHRSLIEECLARGQYVRIASPGSWSHELFTSLEALIILQ